MKKSPAGVVLYDGPSILDGQPIIIIATFKSQNAKTGDMIQTWIMRKDIHPLDAIHAGADSSVCGSCPHRGIVEDGRNSKRSCYVAIEKAPSNIWKSYHKGNYVPYDSSTVKYFQGRKIRWGAYGDPSLIPESVVSFLSLMCEGHTGYTHLWRDPRFAWAKAYFQASCDSLRDYMDASTTGWGTFRVVPKEPANDVRWAGVHCPADQRKGDVFCLSCTMCNGKTSRHVWIPAHGRGAVHV